MIFYTTIPHVSAFRLDVPVFVNRNAIFKHGPGATGRPLPKARNFWALDSGGFTELLAHGFWSITHRQYIHEVRRCAKEIGKLTFAASLDWMTEDQILARTGRTVEDHQELTIESYLRLRTDGGPDLEHLWLPVLQGACPPDYLRHFESWMTRGIDLRMSNVVGVGSVCRQWSSTALKEIFEGLNGLGLRRLHGFGVKQSGLEWKAILSQPTRPDVRALYERAFERGYPYELLEEALREDPEHGSTTWEETEASVCKLLYSADSAAWSLRARDQANEVRAARRKLAKLRGAGEPREEGGVLWLGSERVGPLLLERAGERLRPPRGPDDVEPALLPTQILPWCARRAAAWTPGRGKGRKPHESCTSCHLWALEYRLRLRAQLEPEGCWQEEPYLRALPPPSWAWHQAQIEAATRAAAAWERFGPEHFGLLSDMPRWARLQALRRRAAAGDAEAERELRREIENPLRNEQARTVARA